MVKSRSFWNCAAANKGDGCKEPKNEIKKIFKENPEKDDFCFVSPTGLSLYSIVYFLSADWRYIDARKTEINNIKTKYIFSRQKT